MADPSWANPACIACGELFKKHTLATYTPNDAQEGHFPRESTLRLLHKCQKAVILCPTWVETVPQMAKRVSQEQAEARKREQDILDLFKAIYKELHG